MVAGRLPASLRPYVDTSEPDQRDVAAVVRATRDAAAVYWVDPSADATARSRGTRRLDEVIAEAVVANAIPRLAFQSSGGAEHRHGFGEIDGLGATEELLDATGASVAHLRCG